METGAENIEASPAVTTPPVSLTLPASAATTIDTLNNARKKHEVINKKFKTNHLNAFLFFKFK